MSLFLKYLMSLGNTFFYYSMTVCVSAQSKVLKDIVGWVWCWRTWLAHT